ncbi:MAG: IPT/TIG domain-containing protein [Planctomycetes bacterium]|nr:IPT/TIG domain-containing protein [Planctomycetota bacterium]
MTGDGKLDVIGTQLRVAVALGDGAGGFSRPLVFGGGGQPTAIACADFDGDGDVDVATANHADESVSILLNVSPPGILSILPRGGIAGTRVWIRGLRLGSPSVRFGGVPATSIEQRSDDTIVAVAPEGSGTVDVAVANREGETVARRGFTYLTSDLAARAGNVGTAVGPPADVVTINGNSGTDFERAVTLLAESAFSIEVATAPGASSSPFALYAWVGPPSPVTATPQSLGGAALGTMCLPTPLSGGKPRPFRIWNNLPDGSRFGDATAPSNPAPWTVFRHKPNRMRRGIATLQGFMADANSTNSVPISITNAVVLTLK